MYMSYCRFEGTLAELRACMSEVEEHVNGEAEYAISEREIRSFRSMVQEFRDFLRDMCIIDDEGMIDKDALDETCDDMRKGGEDN